MAFTAPTNGVTRPPTYVYDFTDDAAPAYRLLGAKGAGLATMTRLGLPVPPGFTVTTEACRGHLRPGTLPAGLTTELDEHLDALEAAVGRPLGDSHDPLLVSVRPGSTQPAGAIMETVLNLGLNDQSVRGLAAQVGDERFAFDSYRRLIQMFAVEVFDIGDDDFQAILAVHAAKAGTATTDLPAHVLRDVVCAFKDLIVERTGRVFPRDARGQVRWAVTAALGSWHRQAAVAYRRDHDLEPAAGLAVTVMPMVFGNKGPCSGTGVARCGPANELVGSYLPGGQGDDVLFHPGVRPLGELRESDPESYAALAHYVSTLRTHHPDLLDVEFTVEAGKLWILQMRLTEMTAWGRSIADTSDSDMPARSAAGRQETS